MQQKISVKFKIGSKAYSFLAEDISLNVGDNVVVETILGQAYGKVDKIEEYNPAKENRELKKVIRKATKEDNFQYEKMNEKERVAIQETKNLATKLKLDMNVVNADYSLDGSKVIIDFIAEDRVDFRDLVKELATKLKSRIELRQIGIRDQAKMVGGIGICGRVCCCAAHLKDFEKVSIKMAKSQGLALNPTKISGSCGRLMCCLAYEDNYYSEVYPKIPKLNKEIKTPDGVGVVIYTNALKQTVTVKITSKDGSSTIKDYTLDALTSKEQSASSSLQDYKNYANSLEKNKQENNNSAAKNEIKNIDKENNNKNINEKNSNQQKNADNNFNAKNKKHDEKNTKNENNNQINKNNQNNKTLNNKINKNNQNLNNNQNDNKQNKTSLNQQNNNQQKSNNKKNKKPYYHKHNKNNQQNN